MKKFHIAIGVFNIEQSIVALASKPCKIKYSLTPSARN
jgi:hypothetical protein